MLHWQQLIEIREGITVESSFRTMRLRQLLKALDGHGLAHNKPYLIPMEERARLWKINSSRIAERTNLQDIDHSVSEEDDVMFEENFHAFTEGSSDSSLEPGGQAEALQAENNHGGDLDEDPDPQDDEVFLVRLGESLRHLKVCLMATGLIAIRRIISRDHAESIFVHSDPNFVVDMIVALNQNMACSNLSGE